ncbi:GTP cyclohydrolase FolE2 [Luteimonas terricola]|uniref:GTP cyclohydrolase FolE2 n=1 Tax=Luteimonas terricola TaxID=645597 RepID=A0ABQ2EAM0_9GAMM|nr:GTP cyclohydrolase FolE2 [Luteimonas terricola]GGK02570.1 GTP cyclohydrolase FolE2 [Luteimonas terricola]
MTSSNPPPALPDVAYDLAAAARPLDWVGMRRVALPLRVAGDGGESQLVAASADIGVDLASAETRGIHMSRLYLLLQDALSTDALTASALRTLLRECIDSQSGLATTARLSLRWEQLLKRRALASDNAGWKSYPVEVDATLSPSGAEIVLAFGVEYSSTCPASAALSRRANADRFEADFADDDAPSKVAMHEWLASGRGMAATPHAQRSRADVRVVLRNDVDALPLLELIDAIEAALGTPVQTAVKREDEQAFARANADNLMFCEDAARRVAAVVSTSPRVASFDVTVSHFESLHAHDAVARVRG